MKNFEQQCAIFTDLLLRYNKTHNITGAKNAAKVQENIEDSIYPLQFLEQKQIKNAIDVGSGAGFPGFLLALVMHDTHFTLFEPIKKKSAFLHLAKTLLHVENITIASQRVEEHSGFTCDLITSRAVTKSQELVKICRHFITPQTKFLLYKGENVIKEVDNLQNYEIYSRGHRNYLLIKDVYGL
ncbi:MAG: 16S rRNA (guanine(527)-N(7))-methyltransferase RsmG [Sulfurospirillum sp.]|nr:16S rRNA (guanine(527)-N(7))-methyltransferase RsmG [Sulfurospirillum sp.]